MSVAESITSILALGLALFVAFATRDVFWPRVKFRFGLHLTYPKIVHERVGNKPIHTTFVLTRHRVEVDKRLPKLLQSHVPIAFHISNTSRRKLSDVKIDIEVSQQFLVPNRAFEQVYKEYELAFPEHGEDDKSYRELLRIRTARLAGGGMGVVTYDIGTLRPGEFFGTFDLLALCPERSENFRDARFQDKLVARVAEILAASTDIRMFSIVRAFVYSDLTEREMHEINLCAAVAEEKADFDDIVLKHYVNAFWLNKGRQGKAYWRTPYLDRRPAVVVEQPIEVIELEPSFEIVKEEIEQVTVRTSFDPLSADRGVGTIYLPGYPVLELPREISDPDLALAHIGYSRTYEPKRFFAPYLRASSRKIYRQIRSLGRKVQNLGQWN